MLKIKNSTPCGTEEALKKCQSNSGIKFKGKNDRKKAIMSVSVIAAIVTVISLAANFRLGYTVKVDDTVLGTVATKGEYYQVLDEIKTEVNSISEIEFSPAAEEEFSMGIVAVNSFTEKEELAENVKAISQGMTEAYTITADGQFVTALAGEDEANKLKNTYLENFKSENEAIEVSYGAQVIISAGYVPEDTVCKYDEAIEELLKGKYVMHTVAAEETLETISAKYGVEADEIIETNGAEEIAEGMNLKIYTGEPVIPIKTVEYINGDVEIPYETVTKEDDTIYQGQTRVETPGVNGKKYVHAYITRVNDIITEENIIESTVLTEPVTQVELIGTKELPPSAGTGEFIMPTSGTLTSPYGARWGRTHAGIDVGAPTGTPIYAADNGIVIESEYRNNGYGNIVKIDHQNGFVTYYAHCSALYVKEGDVVAKGDKIAAVGSTGRSTGPHLHFEIRKDGNAQNPYNYIK